MDAKLPTGAAEQQDGHLGVIDDRGAIGSASCAEVADGERAAAKLVDAKLGARARRQQRQLAGEIENAEPIGVANDRHESPRGVSTATPRLTYCL